MPLPRRFLEELLASGDDFGAPMPPRRGIPRDPGMLLDDPSSDERLDALLGIDEPELDEFQEEEFDIPPLEQFLERMSAGGLPQGLQQPRGFGQGLLSGIAGGAIGRGQRVGERRKKFELAQTKRAAERDQANLQATRDARLARGTSKREFIRESRAERRERKKYEDETVLVTPAMLQEKPWLGRISDQQGRVPLKYGEPEKAEKADKERIVAIDTPSGPRYVRESEALGKAPAATPRPESPAKPAQLKARGFHARGVNALETIEMAEKGGTLEDRIAKSGTYNQYGLRAPNPLQSVDQRRYNQAQREFAMAFLRKESGATITETEQRGVSDAYFVQPGDDPRTIAAKRQSRRVVLEGMRLEGEGPGEDTTASAPATPVPPTWKRVK